jgi:hypothetical protein
MDKEELAMALDARFNTSVPRMKDGGARMRARFCGLSWQQFLWLLAMTVTASLGTALLRVLQGVPTIVRVASILAPMAFGVLYVARFIRDMREMDELEIRMGMEAAAFALAGVFVLAVAYPVAESAGFVGSLQPHYVILAFSGLAVVGYALAWRRYK